MIDLVYLVPLVVSFIATFALTPIVIRFMKQHGMVGEDLNKFHRPKVAEMGGIAVLLGFFSGVFLFLLMFRTQLDARIMAVLFAISGCAFTGLLDDLVNLRWRSKAVLPLSPCQWGSCSGTWR
jgi:UDP-N-acetylglucosamine--dolichyl-phosphate N-acetylglucosaminephosphotransferase